LSTAEYVSTVPPNSTNLNGLTSLSSCEYWKLTKDDGTSDVTVTLSWPVPSCEAIQEAAVQFCKFNTTTNKWDIVPSLLNQTQHSITSNELQTSYGNLTFGYALKRVWIDTRGLDSAPFTISGGDLPNGVSYVSGKSGPSNDGNIPLIPILAATGSTTILMDVTEGAENQPMKVMFDLDNASVISNVRISTPDVAPTFLSMDQAFYSINNTPTNGKSIKFLRGDETNSSLFVSNLTTGVMMNNTGGSNFQITGITGYTISAFNILTLDNQLVKGPLSVATWDGTNQVNEEVSPGVYKYELLITNDSKSYVYNGQLIVK
jgi:hypothetical protein